MSSRTAPVIPRTGYKLLVAWLLIDCVPKAKVRVLARGVYAVRGRLAELPPSPAHVERYIDLLRAYGILVERDDKLCFAEHVLELLIRPLTEELSRRYDRHTVLAYVLKAGGDP